MGDIEVKKLPGSKIELAGELPASALQAALKQTLAAANARVSIPGFRPGNVPETVLRSRIGDAQLLRDAAEIALQNAYPELVKSQQLEVIGPPEVSITKLAAGNPIGFRIVLTVLPDVHLPDYKAIAKGVFEKTEEISVSEKEVNDALERLRNMRRTSTPPEKDVGDEEAATDALPELDDAFAKSVGADSLDELKTTLRQHVRVEKETRARERKRAQTLDSIASAARIEVPVILAETERDRMVADLKTRIAETGLAWEQYLAHIKKTENELKQEWLAEGEKHARYGLTLRAIIAQEHIAPTEKEVDEFAARLRSRPDAKNLDEKRVKEYAYGMLLNEKVFRFLETQADQTLRQTS